MYNPKYKETIGFAMYCRCEECKEYLEGAEIVGNKPGADYWANEIKKLEEAAEDWGLNVE